MAGDQGRAWSSRRIVTADRLIPTEAPRRGPAAHPRRTSDVSPRSSRGAGPLGGCRGCSRCREGAGWRWGIAPMRVIGSPGSREWRVKSVHGLLRILHDRDFLGGGIFFLAPGDSEYTYLCMRVSGDVADVHFYPEEGHSGFRCLGGVGLPEGGRTTSLYNGCDPGSGEETPNEFILAFQTACRVAAGFLISGGMPERKDYRERRQNLSLAADERSPRVHRIRSPSHPSTRGCGDVRSPSKPTLRRFTLRWPAADREGVAVHWPYAPSRMPLGCKPLQIRDLRQNP